MSLPADLALAACPRPDEVVVTDSIRDHWDWVVLGGGLASVVVGFLAVWLAYQANNAAKKASSEATKARQAIADERRRTFELEVLRDLLASADNLETVSDIIYNQHLFSARHTGRLSMLPHDELTVWRRLFVGRRFIDVIASNDSEREVIEKEMQHKGNVARDRQTRELIRARLVADVVKSVEKRMAERDE